MNQNWKKYFLPTTFAAALALTAGLVLTPMIGIGTAHAQTVVTGNCLANASVTRSGSQFRMRAQYVCDATGYSVQINNGRTACFSRGLTKNRYFTIYRPWYRIGYSWYKPSFNYGSTFRC